MCRRPYRLRHPPAGKRRLMNIGVIARRATPGIAAIALVLLAGGCSNSHTPVAPASVAADAQSPLQGDPSLGPQLAAVRDATAQFHDVSAAIAAGYLDPTGRICDQIA